MCAHELAPVLLCSYTCTHERIETYRQAESAYNFANTVADAFAHIGTAIIAHIATDKVAHTVADAIAHTRTVIVAHTITDTIDIVTAALTHVGVRHK
jgi:hypothetical protein